MSSLYKLIYVNGVLCAFTAFRVKLNRERKKIKFVPFFYCDLLGSLHSHFIALNVSQMDLKHFLRPFMFFFSVPLRGEREWRRLETGERSYHDESVPIIHELLSKLEFIMTIMMMAMAVTMSYILRV